MSGPRLVFFGVPNAIGDPVCVTSFDVLSVGSGVADCAGVAVGLAVTRATGAFVGVVVRRGVALGAAV